MPSKLAIWRADIDGVTLALLQRDFTFTTFSRGRLSVSTVESITKPRYVITWVGITHDFSRLTVKPRLSKRATVMAV